MTAPVITGVSPPHSVLDELVDTEYLQINGLNLSTATAVRFDQTPAASITVVGGTIRAYFPSGLTRATGKVTVTTPDGSTSHPFIIYKPGPWITPPSICLDLTPNIVPGFSGTQFAVYSAAHDLADSEDDDRVLAASHRDDEWLSMFDPASSAGATFDGTRWAYLQTGLLNVISTKQFGGAFAFSHRPVVAGADLVETWDEAHFDEFDSTIDSVELTVSLVSVTGTATGEGFQVRVAGDPGPGLDADMLAAIAPDVDVPATSSPGVVGTWTRTAADSDIGPVAANGEGYWFPVVYASDWQMTPVPAFTASIEAVFSTAIRACGTPPRYRPLFGSNQPPQRQFPRDDGLGISTRRSWPPNVSQQYGLRRGTINTYQ